MRAQAGASAQLRRHADRRCRRPSLRKRKLRRIPALYGKRLLRQLTISGRKRNRSNVAPVQIGYQDMGGRVTRYSMRSTEKTDESSLRDIQLGDRWMDAMSVDYSCLFPTGMLNIGMHPQKEMEVELCWAYNRWLTEKVLPEASGRFYSMLCLPFSDPEAALRHVYYSSQPMEIQDYGAIECTFRMMNAETQLLYSSDYPHWDFDLPSTIWDLPFLSEKAKHNILGGTAGAAVQAAAAQRQAEREPQAVRQFGRRGLTRPLRRA
jgi:hypothetical protein